MADKFPKDWTGYVCTHCAARMSSIKEIAIYPTPNIGCKHGDIGVVKLTTVYDDKGKTMRTTYSKPGDLI